MTRATKIRELRVLRAKHASALMNPPFICKLGELRVLRAKHASALLNPPFICNPACKARFSKSVFPL
jgi:hypothetical protein